MTGDAPVREVQTVSTHTVRVTVTWTKTLRSTPIGTAGMRHRRLLKFAFSAAELFRSGTLAPLIVHSPETSAVAGGWKGPAIRPSTRIFLRDGGRDVNMGKSTSE